MKKIVLVLTAVSVVFFISFGYANKNKDDAENYCKKLRNEGKECKVSAVVGCGAGWTKLKSFRGRGKDYFVCQKNEDVGKKRKEKCEKWCRDYKDKNKDVSFTCECRQSSVCSGPDFKKGEFWGGVGKNYIACVKSKRGEATDKLRDKCMEWCYEQNCDKCDYCYNGNLCRGGDKTQKRFSGFGSNYVACRGYGKSLKEKCEDAKKACPDCVCLKRSSKNHKVCQEKGMTDKQDFLCYRLCKKK